MKKIFWIALTALLVACAPAGTAVSPAPTPNSSPIIPLSRTDTSSVPSPLSSKTKTTTASLKTPVPAPTSLPCFDLTRPANGAHLSDTGRVEFAWESQGGAQLYILSLISPEGLREDSRTRTTTFTRSIKASSKTGVYYWSVTAYDGKGDLICNPGFVRFTSGAVVTDGQASAGSEGIGDQTSSGSEGTGDQTSSGSGRNNGQTSTGSGRTDNRPPYGSVGNNEPGSAGIEIVPSFPEPTIKPSDIEDIENIEIAPPAPPIKPPERIRAIIADLVRDGIQEKIFVERAAISQYNALPFDLSLLRIAPRIDLAQNKGTFSVLSVPVEVVSSESEPLPLDLVPSELAPADIAATLTEELIVAPTEEPPQREPPATELPATKPPLRWKPPATEPPLIWKPPATEPPATEPPLRWKPPATEPPATEPPLRWKPPATEPPLIWEPPATELPATKPPPVP